MFSNRSAHRAITQGGAPAASARVIRIALAAAFGLAALGHARLHAQALAAKAASAPAAKATAAKKASAAAATRGAETGLRFEVTFPAGAHAEPITGGVFVMISRNAEREPRLAVSRTGAPFFGRDIEKLKPGEPATIDNTDLGSPLERLTDSPQVTTTRRR